MLNLLERFKVTLRDFSSREPLQFSILAFGMNDDVPTGDPEPEQRHAVLLYAQQAPRLFTITREPTTVGTLITLYLCRCSQTGRQLLWQNAELPPSAKGLL